MKIHDLSMTVSSAMPAYPGDPLVSVRHVKTHDKEGCNLTALTLGTHSGTHIDVPLHHLANGADTVSFPLEKFLGQAIVLDIPKGKNQAISAEELANNDIRAADIVLVATGWEKYHRTDQFFEEFPYFSEEAAALFVEKKVKAVGTDSPSFDGPVEGTPVHHLLLSNEIGLIEGLVNLGDLAGKRVFFCAVPLKIEEGDGSPVRAFAIVEGLSYSFERRARSDVAAR